MYDDESSESSASVSAASVSSIEKRRHKVRSRRRQCYTLLERQAICAHLLSRDRYFTLDRISRKEKEALCITSGMDGKRLLKMLDNARNHPIGPEQEKVVQNRLLRWYRQCSASGMSVEPSANDVDQLSRELCRRFLEANDPLIVQRRVVAERLAFDPLDPSTATMYRLRYSKKLNCDLFPFFQYLYVRAGLSSAEIPDIIDDDEGLDIKREMQHDSGQSKVLEDVAAAEVIMQLAKMSRSPQTALSRPSNITEVPTPGNIATDFADSGISLLSASSLYAHATSQVESK